MINHKKNENIQKHVKIKQNTLEQGRNQRTQIFNLEKNPETTNNRAM